MSLEQACERLGWPGPEAILDPRGAGPRVLAKLAQRKIGQALHRRLDGAGARVGVLVRAPGDDATEEPVAVVCAFERPVSLATLAEAHRLAWSFCRSRLLLVVEPHQVRAWTCCELPTDDPTTTEHPAEIDSNVLTEPVPSIEDQAKQSLSWLRLASGEFFERHRQRFPDTGRADRMLLENLRHVRVKLIQEGGLDPDIAHDLLARLIFIQFLFDRTDSKGRPALSEQELSRLHNDGTLSATYDQFAQILRNRDDTYQLFRWLTDRFNGDLFPGKGRTEKEKEASWQQEQAAVSPDHLRLLADFVEGRTELHGGQRSLWRLYAFDAIPLEFISSIYEEFAGEEKGVHYTPGHLVDFVLDGVLPWGGQHWDLKILDPACGSGVFLVKAFQRLVYRWRRANPGADPKPVILQSLLERNLFGIDTDRHAVRAASFSLYLAMCDEIDPRDYLENIRFPPLRERRLIRDDFFAERGGFDTVDDAQSYDLVVGNAPWGKTSASVPAKRWAKKHNWLLPYKSVGPLFLAKAARLTKKEGWVSMLQPASTLLFNRDKNASEFRRRLFEEHHVTEVTNLAALRFRLFNRKAKKAKPPICIITFQPRPPDGGAITYICPKPHDGGVTDAILIEPHDVHAVEPDDAVAEPWSWTVLLWGGPRDLELIRRLRTRMSLAKVGDKIKSRFGIMRPGPGKKGKPQPDIVGRRILDKSDLPPGTFLRLDATSLPVNQNEQTAAGSSTTLEPFKAPQLLIRRTWKKETGRFGAVLVKPDPETDGALCSERYVTVHAASLPVYYLEAACLSMNSKLASYFLVLTGRKLASFTPEALKEEVLEVPVPEPRPGLLDNIKDVPSLDDRFRQVFPLKQSEWTLIDDFFSHTIPLRRAADSVGAADATQPAEPDLQAYCDQLVRVLQQGGGTHVGATIFRPTGGIRLPLSLVAIHLDKAKEPTIRVATIKPGGLWNTLLDLNRKLSPHGPAGGGVFFHRVARVYDLVRRDGRLMPTIYFVKPSVPRYWTQSTALRDADEVMAEALANVSRGPEL